MKKTVLILLIVLVSFLNYLYAHLQIPLTEEKFSGLLANNQHLNIHTLRLENKGGDPVIVSHSLALSAYEMLPWGKLFWEKGYDVWLPHVRGHGIKKKATTVSPYHDGDYNFEKMFEEDIPLIIQRVRSTSNKKIIVLGHSMGGMLWERYLNAHPEHKKYIKCFISLGAPADFKDISQDILDYLRPLKMVIKNRHIYLPFKVLYNHQTTRGLHYLITGHIVHNFPYGVLDNEKLDRDEYLHKDIAGLAFSHIHTDYFNNFLRWGFKGHYLSMDEKTDFGKEKNIFVPTLYISGEVDSLANPKWIFERLRDYYPQTTQLHLFEMKGFAHGDFLFQREIDLLKRMVLKFSTSPKKFKANSYVDEGGKLKDRATLLIDRK